MTVPVTMIRAKFLALKPAMDERLTRLWAGAEAEAIGAGGISLVAAATGMSRTTIRAGRDELRKGVATCDVVKVRRAGAGRPSIEARTPGIVDALERLIEPVTRDDRESPLRWTSKSTRKLSAELAQQGLSISPQKVGQLLHASGYRLQGMDKPIDSASHALRVQQLELINRRVREFHARGAPVISVHAGKQQLVRALDHAPPAWQPRHAPVAVHDVHDPEPDPRACHGVSEVVRDVGRVNTAAGHDTPAFAVRAIAEWWEHMARGAAPDPTELLVVAAGDGSCSAWARRWKAELQQLADRTGLEIAVSYLPPSTSKWTRIEHRLICRVTEDWCDRPQIDRETVVQLIGGIHPVAGSAPLPALDAHGLPAEWNYTLHSRRDCW